VGYVDPEIGGNYNLESIAAAVLGGVEFTGGEGGVIGALAGSLFLLALLNASTISSLNPFTQLIVEGAAMLVAAIVVTPLGGWEVLPVLSDPVALLAGIGVGISSSVIPYVTDQLAMRRLPRASYALVAEAQRAQLRGRVGGVRPNATFDIRTLGVTSLSGTVTGPGGPSALFSVEIDGPTHAQRSFTDGPESG